MKQEEIQALINETIEMLKKQNECIEMILVDVEKMKEILNKAEQ